MDVNEYLKGRGYTTLPSSWYGLIDTWLTWYGGKTAFHEYKVYNGKGYVGCTRATLGMAKKICEDKADLLLNEKVTVHVTRKSSAEGAKQTTGKPNPDQDFVDTVLEDNNFWVRGNQLVELANATGTGAFVEYLQKDSVAIDYVPAPFIYPLAWRNVQITECAFASEQKTKDGKRTYVNLHVLENGHYIVENHLFDESGQEVELPAGVEPRWNTNSTMPLFQIITPNIVNNVNVARDQGATCPMGVSVFANAIDVLEGIDLVYDSYENEFRLGRKRIFVNSDLVQVVNAGTDGDGNAKLFPAFDTNDTVFYGLPLGESSESAQKALSESNMSLRADEHEKALQSRLDILSSKCGFGKGYYKFDTDNVQTATGVISQNSQLFRKIRKDEIILEKALTDMVRAILFLGKRSTDLDISINFDDSIIEDTDAIARRAMLELQEGIIDHVEYVKRVYGYTEEAAVKFVADIQKRKPIEDPPDPFGGGVDIVNT